MIKDKRIGEQFDEPNPKCPHCKTHMKTAQNIFGKTTFWLCPKCGARYFITGREED